MDLFLVRHGIAVEPTEWSGSDPSRPLTEEGVKRTRQVARRIAQAFPAPELIVASPYLRAQQTADLFQEEWSVRDRAVTDALVPMADPEQFLEWVAANAKKSLVAVAHEPLLSQLAGRILTGRSGGGVVEFKKAAVARFDFDSRDGFGVLRALLPPKAML